MFYISNSFWTSSAIPAKKREKVNIFNEEPKKDYENTAKENQNIPADK